LQATRADERWRRLLRNRLGSSELLYRCRGDVGGGQNSHRRRRGWFRAAGSSVAYCARAGAVAEGACGEPIGEAEEMLRRQTACHRRRGASEDPSLPEREPASGFGVEKGMSEDMFRRESHTRAPLGAVRGKHV
jgi:hypothetical protein